MSSQVRQLEEMGFTEEVARRVLAECVWDVNRAIDRLLQGGVPSAEAKPPPDPAEAWPQKPGDSSPASGGSTTASGSSTPRSPGQRGATPPTTEQRPTDVEERAPSSAVPAAAHDRSASIADSLKTGEAHAVKEVAHEAVPRRQRPSDGEKRMAPSAERSAVANADSSTARDRSVPTLDSAEVGGMPAAEESASAASPAEIVPAAPRKRIERVETPWQAQDDTQMTAGCGDFVLVWTEHGALNGWVFAEALDNGAAGWLPAFSLRGLPEHQRWLRALRSCAATHSTQRDVEEGSVLLVNVDSRTDVGWVYAEAPEDGHLSGGWVPANCLEQTSG